MKTHKEVTLSLLRRGWTTALECAQAGGCLSLSQRVGEFRRAGVSVIDKWITTPSGARIKAYRIAR
jgi:hypothetical protein